MLSVCAFLVGCITTTYTTGRNFDSSKIDKIEKDSTTSDELLALLGRPDKTWVLSADGVVWEYSWIVETNRTHMGWSSPVTVIDGYKKNLQVLVEKGRVVNFTFNDGPFHAESK